MGDDGREGELAKSWLILIVLGAITLYIIGQAVMGLLDPILGMFGHIFGLFEMMVEPLMGALSGVFGALGNVPSITYEPVSEHNIGVFEEFVANVNSRCEEEDSQSPPIQWEELPGNPYNWDDENGQIGGIDVKDGNKLVAYGERSAEHMLLGSQEQIVREAENCGTVEVCVSPTCDGNPGDAIDGVHDTLFGRNGRINPIDNYAYARGEDTFVGVGPGEFAGEEVSESEWNTPGNLDAEWGDCGGPCGEEGKITRVCTEAYGDFWSDEVKINIWAENTAGETGQYNVRIRPESGKSHVLRPCDGLIGCGLSFKELSAGEEWEVQTFDSGWNGWAYKFINNKGYMVQLRKQDPDDPMGSADFEDKKYLVDAVLVEPEDVPDVGDEICNSYSNDAGAGP